MTPFYTAGGDDGTTGFLGKGRISKASARIEAVGSVDEASAALGMARALCHTEKTQSILLKIQRLLYKLMSEISASNDLADKLERLDEGHVAWLEEQIASIESEVDIPREFIIPGDSPGSAALALARTIVRRAERRAVAFYENSDTSKPVLLTFLNRLSSLLFILEIYEISVSGDNIQLAKEA